MSEDGDESKDNDEEWLFSRSALLLATVLIVGIAGTGVLRRLLGEAGLNDLGVVVWTLGYGGTVVVVWFGWIRPLDIGGPSRGLTDVEENEEETQP
jgi:hypothetical protein